MNFLFFVLLSRNGSLWVYDEDFIVICLQKYANSLILS